MKKIKIYTTIFSIILMACNNPIKNNVVSRSATKLNEPVATCYLYSRDKNVVSLQITIDNKMVTGNLIYNYFEKDKNIGNIVGVMMDDTLFADYNFKSEGANSIREVAFLKIGNQLHEGYGEVVEKSGKMVFKSRATLNFENKMPLTKTDCKQVIKN